jgi:hypothetical protein
MRRGILLLGAHFGSYEATRVLGINQPHIRFRTVIDIDQNPAMSRLLNSLNPQLAATVINSRDAGPGVALAIRDAWARARSSRCLRTGCAGRQVERHAVSRRHRAVPDGTLGNRRGARRPGGGVLRRVPRT